MIRTWELNPTREEHITQRLKLFEALTGSLIPFDEARERSFCEQEYARANNYDAVLNHGRAAVASSDRQAELLGVSVPTLVIHGTEDPVLPYEHGKATAEIIPNAKLMSIEKLGHEFPSIIWSEVIASIVDHTS